MFYMSDSNIRSGLVTTNPSVFLSLFPALAVLADTNNDFKTIVASIQPLAMALGPIADEGQGIIFEIVLELGQRPVGAFIYNLLGTCEIKGLDSANGLLGYIASKPRIWGKLV